ncbi:MAG: GNAT family N-acetyltransferase [Coxiella sp. (in: Bacteria)]|nr:MAG: GNAT family N-acetyltransferase [Coxiella sp. (in: g-proteobacteria)]
MITAIYNYPFPTLEIDEQFILREQQVEDSAAFFEYYSDPEVARHILAKTPNSLKDAQSEVEYCRKLFQYRHGLYWSIARKSDNRMIGAVGLYMNNHHHRAEICYDLHKDYWRKGIMSKAMLVVMEYMFKYAGLHRIEAITVKENQPSISILKKLGFSFEGSLDNYRFYNNKSHDVEMFGLTKAKFNDLMKQYHDTAATADQLVTTA